MSLDYINSKKIRRSFGKIPLVTSLPNLIEVQKRSFDNFLQLKAKPESIVGEVEIGAFNADKSELAIETLTMAYSYFSKQ